MPMQKHTDATQSNHTRHGVRNTDAKEKNQTKNKQKSEE